MEVRLELNSQIMVPHFSLTTATTAFWILSCSDSHLWLLRSDGLVGTVVAGRAAGIFRDVKSGKTFEKMCLFASLFYFFALDIITLEGIWSSSNLLASQLVTWQPLPANETVQRPNSIVQIKTNKIEHVNLRVASMDFVSFGWSHANCVLMQSPAPQQLAAVSYPTNGPESGIDLLIVSGCVSPDMTKYWFERKLSVEWW